MPEAEPALRYATLTDVPARCPRAGCGGLMKPWPDGKACVACGRIAYVDARPRERLE
jgi:hypothetical protein